MSSFKIEGSKSAVSWGRYGRAQKDEEFILDKLVMILVDIISMQHIWQKRPRWPSRQLPGESAKPG